MNMDAVTFELSIMIGICILYEQPTAGAAVSIENKIPFFFYHQCLAFNGELSCNIEYFFLITMLKKLDVAALGTMERISLK